MKPRLTPDQRAQALAWYAEGIPAGTIAKRFGCDRCTVRRIVEPGFREMRAEQIRSARSFRSPIDHFHAVERVEIPQAVAIVRERLREAYRLRAPAAAILNDPPPGFSALDSLSARQPGLCPLSIGVRG